jgi:hypothetical protein
MTSRSVQRLALCLLGTVLASTYAADALMARITCHCSTGDVPGVMVLFSIAITAPPAVAPKG